jgi:cellulose synthase/poly-beta-1,6-N-acetylglucosamine synthase-like glycosyltransferase
MDTGYGARGARPRLRARGRSPRDPASRCSSRPPSQCLLPAHDLRDVARDVSRLREVSGPVTRRPDHRLATSGFVPRRRQERVRSDRPLHRFAARLGLSQLELIVVDDASTDGTRNRLIELAREHQQLRLLLLLESVKKKKALVHGLTYATGEILLFTDSDCVLAADAVERVVDAFAARPDVGAVSGDARALNGDRNFLTKTQDAWYDGQFSIWKAAESVFGALTCISGPLAAFRREAVYNFFPAWAGDTFLGKEFPFATDRQLTGYLLGSDSVGPSLKRKYADSPFVREEDYPARPWRIAYVESARAWTVVPPTLRSLVKQQIRWKKSFIRNLFFTARFYWRKGLVPAFIYYAHAAFIVATPFMAARYLLFLPLSGEVAVAPIYAGGVFLKGLIWGLAYKAKNPACGRWIYRPFMSLMSTFLFSLLLPYAALTIRRQVWARGDGVRRLDVPAPDPHVAPLSRTAMARTA